MLVDETTTTSSSDVETDDQVTDDTAADAGADGDQGDDLDKPENRKTAASRINELVAEVKQLRQEAKEREERTIAATPPPPAPPSKQDLSEQDAKAIAYLDKLGYARKEVVTESVKAIEDRIALDSEHNRLGSTYDGADGRPRYDKAKVEAYMRERGVYDPEIAYKALHETELLDWYAKKSKPGTTTQRPFVEKPGGSGRTDNNTITREKLQEVAANPTPENRAWYERNRDKIMSLMAEGKI